MGIWVKPSVGHPENVHADFGPQFRSTDWESYLQMCGVKLITLSVECHNALGIYERNHEYLRQIYQRVQMEDKGLELDHILSLSVSATNSTT